MSGCSHHSQEIPPSTGKGVGFIEPTAQIQDSFDQPKLPSRAIFDPSIKIDTVVDIRDMLERNPARAMNLLEKAFKLYYECFPDPGGRECQETILACLQDPEVNWRVYVALDKDETVLGGRHVNIMETAIKGELVKFAWGEHLYVNTDPEYRRQKIGSCIVQQTNAMLRNLNVGLVFSEQNDPYLMTHHEVEVDMQSGILPQQRLEFWGKQGYRALNAPYAQPSLDGGDPLLYLRLCCNVMEPALIPESVGFTGKSIDRDAYLSMIRHFHGTFVEDMNADPTSAYIKSLVDSGPTQIALIHIGEPRTFCQERIDLAV